MFQNSLLGIAFDAAMEQLAQEETLMLTQHATKNAKNKKNNTKKNNNDDEDEEEVERMNVEAQNRILDNLFARFDVVENSHNNQHHQQQKLLQSAFTQEQKEKLEQIFTESMIDALTNRHQNQQMQNSENNNGATMMMSSSASTSGFSNFPKNDLIIRAPALGGNVRRYENENETRQADGDDVYFPIYRKEENGNWTIVLKDPQIFLRGPVVDHQQQQNSSIIDSTMTPLQRLIKLVHDDENDHTNNNNKNKSRETKLRSDGVELECDYVVLHVRELPVLKRRKATRRGRE